MLTAFAILVDGLVFASWLFIVALGLTLIFGVMKILNVAHGSFYAFGAYVAANAIGVYYEAGLPPLGGFALMAGAALVVGVVLGTALERGLLRFMYGRDEVLTALVTFAVFLMMEDVIILVWGADPFFAYQPYGLLGVTEAGPLVLSNYDLSLIGLAFTLCAVTWWVLNRTRQGRLLIAVIHDRELAAAFGINVTRMFTLTFVIGAMLGALGGAVTAPMISVTPGIGVEVIVLAFAIVVIGGMGSIWGAVIGAVVVGVSRAAAVHLLPQVELFVIYAVMALVLAFRPEGLFSRAQARKI
ncbi:MAG: branched-chain amino acid ABC transporter permease [Ectothiorhodospiraceae bacterium]|nr:branched-chain amino acid ABC transporter permease [Ectothiorhodospiraceae bacterium]